MKALNLIGQAIRTEARLIVFPEAFILLDGGNKVVLSGLAPIRNPDGSIKNVIEDRLEFSYLQLTGRCSQSMAVGRDSPSWNQHRQVLRIWGLSSNWTENRVKPDRDSHFFLPLRIFPPHACNCATPVSSDARAGLRRGHEDKGESPSVSREAFAGTHTSRAVYGVRGESS